MLNERRDTWTDSQLRAAIKVVSSPFARSGWKYHDYSRYEEEHREFYEEFNNQLDAALGIQTVSWRP